ncbi:Asp23/Gls24 family envelope stress response protein [Streptomyces sp.]|uniref:Asp23/Gls24 family envelope stress response protein n=1 Tax=Streptomyces sp. TaxID=1931 RepID=UPI002F42E4FE
MTRASDLREIAATAARAASDVPGVAHLTPRLADRLRPAVLPTTRTPGVRVLPHDTTRLTTVDISLAVHAGHQATTVARQVRVAVIEALHADHPRVWATEVTVSVTVTAIV